MINDIIYNPEAECLSDNEKFVHQSKLFVKQIKYVYDNVLLFRKKLDALNINIEAFKDISDISKLPFTTKQDLRDTYPFGLFAVPQKDIVRIHASSGTTGKMTVVGYTQNDLNVWAELMARAFSMAGATKEDVCHISYGYGLFTGGLGAHLGSEKIGAVTVPASTGNSERQLMLLKDFQATILCSTPSYALYLAKQIDGNAELNIKDFKLKAGIFGAEPWGEEIRKEIEKLLNITALDIYGLSEIMGPGVAMECCYQNGMHVQDDHIYPEIINPDTGEVLPDGEKGELVLTTLTKEGIPMIRYRTRDIAILTHEKCACGRTTARIKRIQDRTDDMLIIRGVNIFPSQIETVINKYSGIIDPDFQLIVSKKDDLDNLEVQIQIKNNDPILAKNISNKFAKDLTNTIGISARIVLKEEGTVIEEHNGGKKIRVKDLRKTVK